MITSSWSNLSSVQGDILCCRAQYERSQAVNLERLRNKAAVRKDCGLYFTTNANLTFACASIL